MQSAIRKEVLEALDVVAAQGATRDEIVDLIGKTRSSVAITLFRCSQDDLVIETNGRFYLKQYQVQDNQVSSKPVKTQIEPYVNGRISLPAIAKGRSGKHVSVYTSPIEENDIVQVQMCINNQWVKIPLFAGLKICTGPDIPNWSQDQETNQNVSTIRLVKSNGQYNDIQVARGYPVTVTYED